MKTITKKQRVPQSQSISHMEVEVRANGKATVFKVPVAEFKKTLKNWEKYSQHDLSLKKHDPSILEKVIQDATGNASHPGARVKNLRLQKGLTQTELAVLAGTSQANVASAETGNRPLGKELAEKLAKALGVDFRYLL
jgi:DNA-binding XRE family transcriptional regulator